MPRRFKKVPKDKKTGLPKKYVKGAKSPGKQAAEIKATAAEYKRGEKIDIKKVNKSRENQGKKTRRKKSEAVTATRRFFARKRLTVSFLLRRCARCCKGAKLRFWAPVVGPEQT